MSRTHVQDRNRVLARTITVILHVSYSKHLKIDKTNFMMMTDITVVIIDQETHKVISCTLNELEQHFRSISAKLNIKDDVLKLVDLLDMYDIAYVYVDCVFGCVTKTKQNIPDNVHEELVDTISLVAWDIESLLTGKPITEQNIVPANYVIVRIKHPNMVIILHNVVLGNE